VRNRAILVLIALVLAGGTGFALLGSKQPATPATANGEAKPAPVEFELIRLSREGMGVIAGSAPPNGFVDVMSEGRSIGKSRASGAGAWEIVLGTALEPGTHILSLITTDGAGRETRSAGVAVVAVPPPPGRGPELKTAKGGKKPQTEDGVLAVMLPRQGEAPGRVLQRPGQLRPTLALGIDVADFDGAGRTVLAGRAGAGNDVNVYLDGRPAGTVKAGDDGVWSLTLPAVNAARHSIRLEEIGPGNAVVLDVDQAFNPAITMAVDAGRAAAAVMPDPAVWHVVRRRAGGVMRYSQVFRTDQGVAAPDDGDAIKVPGILKPGTDF